MARRITIDCEKDEIHAQFNNGPLKDPMTIDEIGAMLLGAYDGAVSAVLKQIKDSDIETRRSLYEHIVMMFDAFLERLFPEINSLGFDFSDAALIYAQDQIVNEAYDKGISFDEALENYEKKAQEYIANRTTRKS